MKLLIEGELSPAHQGLLQRAALSAQRVEGIKLPCCVALLLMDDEEMREHNRETRGIDQSTDVLSYPSVTYPVGKTAGQLEPLLQREWDPQEGCCYLGDILISLPRAREQAKAYGHPFERELSYLLVHGLFHLFGYDHMVEEDRRKMRDIEEKALAMAQASDEELLTQAREAMRMAYVPYSHFRVGACLLSSDGRLFTGCNVENASYGLTNCAERTAVFKAVSEGTTEFSAIAIAAESFPPWPCGACRQVLSEFAPDLRVLITKGDTFIKEMTLRELLPESFSPAQGVQQVLGKEQHG